MTKKQVTVCMASYNGERYITEQIESVLSQLPLDGEIIIVDDCSVDTTTNIVEKFGDKRIRLIRHEKNRGVVHSFEAALRNASGDVVFLCDQDDVWFPNKIAKVMERFESGANLVVHNAIVVDKELSPLSLDLFMICRASPNPLRNLLRNTLIGATMAFDRSVLEKALPFPDAIGMHDIWIGLIAGVFGQIAIEEEPLIYYRRHENNASMTLQKSNRSVRLRLQERVLTASALAGRFYRSRT